MTATTAPATDNVLRMKEFFKLYDGSMTEFDASAFDAFYDKDVTLDFGGEKELRKEDLMKMNNHVVDTKAIFEVEEIKEVPDGTYASGWMCRADKSRVNVASVSKIENGKFVYIKNLDAEAQEAVQGLVGKLQLNS